MVPDKFEIAYDAQIRRIRMTMRDFWILPDVSRFAAAMQTTAASLGPPPVRLDTLIDARDFPVQSLEVSEALGVIDHAWATRRIGRVAIVVRSTMNKLQARRTLTPGVRTFPSMEDAEAWLAAPEEAGA